MESCKAAHIDNLDKRLEANTHFPNAGHLLKEPDRCRGQKTPRRSKLGVYSDPGPKWLERVRKSYHRPLRLKMKNKRSKRSLMADSP